jgi:hypothetical protein
MNYVRQKAILLAAALCIGLLSGCGTSQLSQEESSIDSDVGSWADLTLPSPSQTMPSLPETTEEKAEQEQDVTDSYKSIFLGLWDNADKTKTYEFLSNENLIVTQGTTSTTYTYWFLEKDGQVELNIFENGAQEAERYSFSQSGNNLTLYDVLSGNAVESLTKRVQEAEEAKETTTPTQETTATAAPTTTPTATAAPTTAPSAEPTVEPTVAPSTAPVVEEVPVVVPEEIQLPQSIYNSLSAVECVLDVVLDGTAFDGENSDSFWNTLARYLSRSMDSDEDGTFTVSTAQVSSAAREIFSGLTTVPDCPQSGDIAALETGEDGTETYRLHWGATGGHDLEVTAYDGVDTIEVTADGGIVYAVRLDSSGAVISVTAA